VFGYRRAILDTAGFTHWMLQDLDSSQIEAFTATWYESSCPDTLVEAAKLRDRLLRAVQDSAAVAELAGNPMLLTILAIIGRRRELPRERRAVYDHAVSVLIEPRASTCTTHGSMAGWNTCPAKTSWSFCA
jgi:predicted NACHT family NTPase